MSKFTEDLVIIALCKMVDKVFNMKKEKKPAKVSTEQPVKTRIKPPIAQPLSKSVETNRAAMRYDEELIVPTQAIVDPIAIVKLPKEEWVSSYDGQEEFQVEVRRGKSLVTIEIEKVEHWCGNVYLVTPRDGSPYYVTGMQSEWKHLL